MKRTPATNPVIIIGLLFGILLFAGCIEDEENATPTLIPTVTDDPTNTPTSTATETPTPTSTDTSTPTSTPTSTATPTVAPETGGGAGEQAPAEGGVVITSEVFPVYYCSGDGSGGYQWYEVEVTYHDGVAVSETILSGPYSGGWQPGCAAGDGSGFDGTGETCPDGSMKQPGIPCPPVDG